jgi:hypothetical protein
LLRYDEQDFVATLTQFSHTSVWLQLKWFCNSDFIWAI